MFLERQTESGEKGVCLFVRLGRGNESDLHSVDPRVLVDVNLGEDDLLLQAKGVVTLSIHLLGDTVEVTDTREGNADESLEELVHLGVYSPTISGHIHSPSSGIDHRLDADHQAFHESCSVALASVVRNTGSLVHLLAETVAFKLTDD